MGPRPDGRGKSGGTPKAGNSGLRQWGRGQTAAERCESSRRTIPDACVNGAAARRPRKVDAPARLSIARRLRQWGRGQTAAESARRLGRDVAVLASMGPRPDGRGKLVKNPDDVNLFERQWGRGQTAAERTRDKAICCLQYAASMGPRPDGRGKRVDDGQHPRHGRASMGPRPDGRGKFGRDPCRCLSARVNGAAARRPRKAAVKVRHHLAWGSASMGPRPDGRGKYAVGWRRCRVCGRQWGRGQTAAERIRLAQLVVQLVASMGPRPDGRGKLSRALSLRPRPRVNGAAARRPRKDVPGLLSSAGGAASMGPRPDGRGKKDRALARPHLQEASMEPRPDGRGKLKGRRLRAPHPASMGPRPDGRGKYATSPPARHADHGVNGAAARRPRKGSEGSPPYLCQTASMGPRPDGRGKLSGSAAASFASLRQWGRGQTAAESVIACTVQMIVMLASMGPRPDGRGKKSPAQSFCSGRPSVNGAAARRPRKARATTGTTDPCTERQWGRGQTAAESRDIEHPAISRQVRQWGRGQTAAESRLRLGLCGRNDLRQWGRGQTAAERF